MAKDIDQLLKDAGYLETPAARLFWRGATPTLRHHIRQVTLLALMVSLPGAGLFAVLTRLEGLDRLWLFLFYLIVGLVVSALLDLLVALLFRLGFPPKSIADRSGLLNNLTIPVAAVFFLGMARLLVDAVALRPLEIQVLIWIALSLTAGMAGGCLRLLFVSRLFWHGIRPPNYRTYPMMTSIALLALAVFAHVQTLGRDRLPRRMPTQNPPVILLAFDLPREDFHLVTDMMPQWPSQSLEVKEDDIASFWTSLGTGTEPDSHAASLVTYKTPLFGGRLVSRDPTQVLPLALLRLAGQASPLADGGRYRKYFWEILDDYNLSTYAFNYWNSFPAASQNGGVMSERWNTEYPHPPYVSGIEISEPVNELGLDLPESLAPTLARENQAWSQLARRAVRADFDLCMAYFPLGDLLDLSAEPAGADARKELWAFRKQRMLDLLESLPEQTKIGIFIASGKDAPMGRPIRLEIISNWFPEFAEPFNSHLEIAPTILNHYGLPRDRLMPEARTKQQTLQAARTADYGEPQATRYVDSQSDSRYYQELKSLGYIR
ncbi:MAG: hypothetical protein QNK37_25960 [Acidobacteriota bacterium]|nr:hypothetical protein [Acidobacteriota bacterium]